MSKKDRETKKEKLREMMDFGNDNLVDIEAKVYTKESHTEKIPGWQTMKGPLKTKKGNYVTYYRSNQHIQDLLDYIQGNKFLKKITINTIQVEAPPRGSDKQYDDPSQYPHSMAIISPNPISFEVPGWILTKASRELRPLKNTYYTVYRSAEPKWNEFIKYVRADKNLNGLVDKMISGGGPEFTQEMTDRSKLVTKIMDEKRHDKVLVNRRGVSQKSKYEYPDGCTSSEDRRKYRIAQRKKRKHE